MKRDFEAALADLTPHLLLAQRCSACGASTDEPCTPDPPDPDDVDPQWAAWCVERIWAALEANGHQLTTHPQLQASRAKVDEGLAELLEAVWAYGLVTEYSCQGGMCEDTGKTAEAQIVFSTVAGAVRFMRATMIRSRCHDDQGYPYSVEVSWPTGDRFRVGIPSSRVSRDVERALYEFSGLGDVIQKVASVKLLPELISYEEWDASLKAQATYG